MSYILDALRRAEAERERGAVPGLHSQAGVHPPAGPSSVRSGRQAGAWLVGGLALGLAVAGLAGWWLSGRMGAAPREGPSLSPVPAAVAASEVAVRLPASGAIAPAAVETAPAPRAEVSDSPAPLQEGPGLTTPRAPVLPHSAAVSPTRGAPTGAVPASAPASLPLRLDTAATAAEGTVAAPSLVDDANKRLSPADRKRVPKLVLGGSMYSEDRASRMLVINDQVVREGDRVAPGVTLEHIGPHAAELSFEGKRFELPY